MDNTQHMHGENGCAECQSYGSMGHRHWRHIVIRILVALFIFWCGVQFGELKAMIVGGNDYGYRNMMGWSTPWNQGYMHAPMMLYTDTYSGAPQATTPTTTAAPAK